MAYQERWRVPAWLRRCWCWALMAVWALVSMAPLARADGSVEDGVSRTVLGILGYTRWPVDGAVLRLCVVGETEYARGLLNAKDPMVGNRPLEVLQADPRRVGTMASCDGIYAGQMEESTWRLLMRNLNGHPVLTISERGALCRIGAMFCLKPTKEGVGFEVNLDSVARSGVRVNPRVLQMARQGSES